MRFPKPSDHRVPFPPNSSNGPAHGLLQASQGPRRAPGKSPNPQMRAHEPYSPMPRNANKHAIDAAIGRIMDTMHSRPASLAPARSLTWDGGIVGGSA